MANQKRTGAKAVNKPAIRLKKPRNPNPPPPPKEYQFKPGQSGNPSGRPKLLGEAYKVKLARVVDGDEQGRTYAEVIADAIALKGMQGDVSAVREIRSATEGDTLNINDWESRVIAAIKSGEVDYDSVVEEFGKALAVELFRKAGKEINNGQ